jgi:hypothetical protein
MRAPGYRPGPLVIPAVVEVVLSWQLPNGKKASNVLHAQGLPAFVNTAAATSLMDAISTSAEWVDYAGFLNENTSLLGVKLRSLDAALLPQFESTSDPAVGLATVGALPEGVALVATLKSEAAGRTGRGRVYLCGFDKSAATSLGAATSTVRAAAVAWLNQVGTALSTTVGDWTIANRSYIAYLSPATGVVVPADATVGDIISATNHPVVAVNVIDSIFDSQRRRK